MRSARASWAILLTFVAATTAILLTVPLVRRVGPGSFLAGPAWWENLNLFAILLLVTIGGVVRGLGGLALPDLGFRRDKLLEGIVVTLAVWAAMQLWPFVASGSAELARTWSDPGIGPTLRWAAVMFLFTALWEELAFRGFLLPQLYLRLPGAHWLRLWAALLLSQVIFASAHIPAHVILRHLSGGALLQMLVLQGFAGLLLGLLYLRTRNLWIPVGIHGLANAPTPLVGGALGWEFPLILLIVAWPWIARRPRHRGFARVVEHDLFADAQVVGPDRTDRSA